MKGFPNQVSDLSKIATGMRVAVEIAAGGEDFGDDGVYGPELVRAGVAGTGHRPQPIEPYIRAQRQLPVGRQSMRTTARGLREMYRYLGLIQGTGPFPRITPLGHQAADFAAKPFDDEQVSFWRHVVNNLTLEEENEASHPYQVMLRLIARQPGISRAKCALALEARDDSPAELDRIVELSDLPEAQIKRRLRVTDSNWNNAKKVLPRFAEQLGDVIKTAGNFVLADKPGAAPGRRPTARARRAAAQGQLGRRAPRSSRAVTPDTIGNAGLADRNEPPIPPDTDPADIAAAIMARADRLKRHNLIVRALSSHLADAEAQLYEDPFDILAMFDASALLIEVKTLDGSAVDERHRVRDALAQLLYYEAFVTQPIAGEAAVSKIGCFEHKPSDEHIAFLNAQGISVVWQDGREFRSDRTASALFQRLGIQTT